MGSFISFLENLNAGATLIGFIKQGGLGGSSNLVAGQLGEETTALINQILSILNGSYVADGASSDTYGIGLSAVFSAQH